jgi:hypothetical protein
MHNEKMRSEFSHPVFESNHSTVSTYHERIVFFAVGHMGEAHALAR